LVEACIGLAVPGRPIRSLVAEDRSAAGVRDQTGPEPHRAALGPRTIQDQRSAADNHGQPRTTTPQVNLSVGWLRDRLDLAYNDEVMALRVGYNGSML